jgi:hypothetical protein
MPAIGALLCGQPAGEGTAKSTLEHLNVSVDRFGGKALGFLTSAFDEDTQSYGAFCSRVFLEIGCAALLGRIDPFRLMFLAEFQAQVNYQYGRSSRSAFRWSGDVIPEDKPPNELWSGDHEPHKISRALLSSYSEHLFWRPALENALNYVQDNHNPALQDIKSQEPDKFIGQTKGRFQGLYSTLSKGVHWEFFTSDIIMDEVTLKDAIKDTIGILSGLAFVSHFIPTAVGCVTAEQALQIYIEIKEAVL